jgi:hypothetical protein
LIDFKIKLLTGLTATSFNYDIVLRNKTNSGELASASGSVTITKDTPQPPNTAPTISFSGATAGTGTIRTNSLNIDVKVTDPDTNTINLMYSLNN